MSKILGQVQSLLGQNRAQLEPLYQTLLEHLVWEELNVPASNFAGVPLAKATETFINIMDTFVRLEDYESEWEVFVAALAKLALLSRAVELDQPERRDAKVMAAVSRYGFIADPALGWHEWALLSYLHNYLGYSVPVDVLLARSRGEQREVLASLETLLRHGYLALDPLRLPRVAMRRKHELLHPFSSHRPSFLDSWFTASLGGPPEGV